MQISELLVLDCVDCAVDCHSKKRVLEQISELAKRHAPQNKQIEILDALIQREKVGSTGIGNGIALPHGRLEGIDKTFAVVVTCTQGIDFDAIDGQPVDVFFAIFIAENQSQEHLITLSHIAQRLAGSQTIEKMRHAINKEQIIEALSTES